MIPIKVKEELKNDPLFRDGNCCLLGKDLYLCVGVIQWHHAVMYGRKRLQESFAIVPLCEAHHQRANVPITKDRIDWIVLNRVSLADMEKYPNIEWAQKYQYLKEKFASEQE